MTEGGVLERVIRQMYPAAAVMLRSGDAARAAVTEAIAAAMRAEPGEWEQNVFRQLLRICGTRAAETDPDSLSDPDSPLAAVFRLPPASRTELAVLLTDLPAGQAAALSGLTPEETEQRGKKALTQLRFLQDGREPDPDAIREAVFALPDANTHMQTAADDIRRLQAEAEKPDAAANVREIRRSTAPAERSDLVSVPLWGVLAAAALLVGLCICIVMLASRRPPAQKPESAASQPEVTVLPQEAVRRVNEQRAPAIAEAQEQVLAAAGKQAKDVIFLSTKLLEANRSVTYEILFTDRAGVQYEYVLDTADGSVTLEKSGETETVPDDDGWQSGAQLRAAALDFAGLETAVFTKEKLASDGEVYYYKMEFTGSDARNYTVYVNAVSGALIKYAVKEPEPPDAARLISSDAAKAQALARAGGLRSDQVIFTKEKREGRVWLISFTLDDGTQYALELNAVTGMANTVDVHPVSADASQLMGMLTARDLALQKAGLTGERSIRFTKAKLDRGNASYVYEFEFDTEENQYEVSIQALSGEVLKYRVWMQ